MILIILTNSTTPSAAIPVPSSPENEKTPYFSYNFLTSGVSDLKIHKNLTDNIA